MNRIIDHSIILASGKGTRCRSHFQLPFPNSLSPSRIQFVIEYPINTIRHLGIKDLTVMRWLRAFSATHSDTCASGSHLGLDIRYIYQDEPNGISAAINQCALSIHGTIGQSCLGDNVFEKPLPWNNLIQQSTIRMLHE